MRRHTCHDSCTNANVPSVLYCLSLLLSTTASPRPRPLSPHGLNSASVSLSPPPRRRVWRAAARALLSTPYERSTNAAEFSQPHACAAPARTGAISLTTPRISRITLPSGFNHISPCRNDGNTCREPRKMALLKLRDLWPLFTQPGKNLIEGLCTYLK